MIWQVDAVSALMTVLRTGNLEGRARASLALGLLAKEIQKDKIHEATELVTEFVKVCPEDSMEKTVAETALQDLSHRLSKLEVNTTAGGPGGLLGGIGGKEESG